MQFDPFVEKEEEEVTDISDDTSTDSISDTEEKKEKPEEVFKPEAGTDDDHYEPLSKNDGQLGRDIETLRIKEEEGLVQRAAEKYGVDYVDLSIIAVESDALRLVPEHEARTGGVAAFAIKGQHLKLGLLNLEDPTAIATIERLRKEDYNVQVCLISRHSLKKAFDRYEDISQTTRTHGSFVDISSEALEEITKRVKTNADVQAVFQELSREEQSQTKTSRVIELIMGSAVATKSSDIHIEPQEEGVRLRFRQDGILEDIIKFDHAVYKSILARFKVLSGMKINVNKDAQDGRFTIDYQKTEIEIRVSSIPGPYGEGVVMRLLDPRNIAVKFDELGIEPYLLEVFKKDIAKPEGIVLTTGPTGSGKTTTLYTFLQYIYDPEIKIITIEDPIEYHLAGVAQTQVDHAKGYDFNAGLRAAMRQDPEVILVGEIRDAETALTAVQAAQTGHLVFSTLHTNNAAGVIPRLLALGINPSLLASTLRLAIAQRLCRKLFPSTKLARPANEEEEKVIRAILRRAEKNGKDIKGRYGFSSDMSEVIIYEPVGTPECLTGYKGRIGIYEAISMNRTIEAMLEKNPSERELRDATQSQGTLSMAEDGIIKVLNGIISLSELKEVVDIELDLEDELANVSPATSTPTVIPIKKVETIPSETPEAFPPSVGGGVTQSVTEERTKETDVNNTTELELLVHYLKRIEAEYEHSQSPDLLEEIEKTKQTIENLL